MKASIITIGTELLVGSIQNTNVAYLSRKLTEIGIDVEYHISVKDEYDNLIDEIEHLFPKVDILFLCGGLGPTNDDMTKEVLAKYLNKNIVLDDFTYNKIIKRFAKNNIEMSPNNKKQALVIEGSKVLENFWGSAPGELIELNNTKFILLPGPPREFEPMVDYYIKDLLVNSDEIIIKSVNIAGIGESKIELSIRNLNLEDENISINTFANFYDTEIKIIAKGNNKEFLNKKINHVIDELYKEFRYNLYSEDNVSLKKKLVQRLLEKNKTISFAESITGGLLSSKITSESGASKILKNSIVAYSNESKTKLLNVKKETLEKYGAISKECAFEMAKGIHNLGLCDIAISTTGEAGPNPMEKEVGQVYACFYFSDENYIIKEYFFNGKRQDIQERIANEVLLYLLFNV